MISDIIEVLTSSLLCLGELSPSYLRILATCHSELGALKCDSKAYSEADSHFTTSCEILESLKETKLSLVENLVALGWTKRLMQDFIGALAKLREAENLLSVLATVKISCQRTIRKRESLHVEVYQSMAKLLML
jgi:hypothetical protein